MIRSRVRVTGADIITAGQPSGGNGLLNCLIAYWPGNEAAGNALDAHINALDLTDINTVTSNPGLVYPLARQYTPLNDEHHDRPGDDALLSVPATSDFTLMAWVYADSFLGDNAIMGKIATWAVRVEYILYRHSTNRFAFLVGDGIANVGLVDANTFGAPSLGVWYLLMAWHDSVNDLVCIQVNNGAVDSTAYAFGSHDDVGIFSIGRPATFAIAQIWRGRIGPTAFWKSAPGGCGVLTADQRTALYNGGAGLTYAQLTT